MTKKTLLLLSCIALGAPFALPTMTAVQAQAQTVTGLNLARAEISGDNGTEVFTKQADGSWKQFGGRGELRFLFEEVRRDATSVYLFDRSRNFNMQIDTSDRTMSFRDTNGNKAVFATVTAFFAAPVGANSAPTQNRTYAPVPQAAPANDTDAEDFDPFADPADKGAPAPAPRSNRDIITGAAGQQPAFTQRNSGSGPPVAAPKALSFDGQWVAEGEIAKDSGDGISTAVSWTFREAIWITTAADDSITIHFDSNPAESMTMVKFGDRYTGSAHTAKFDPIDRTHIRLTLAGIGTSREFTISTVPSGAKLSRSRIKPETDDEIDTFTAGALVPRYNDMFLSYRNEKMDLFNAGRGAGPRIFKAPGAQDFSVESNLQSKTIPYGLRGQEIRRTEGNQLESVITNMASFEKSMSLNFGVTAAFKGATFAADVSREESKGAERSDGTTKAYGIARSEIYALFLDKPNMVLDPGFKFDILRLADGLMTAPQFRIKYGTAYANAIHYGGIGKNQRTVTTAEFKKWSKESTSYKQEGGFDGGPAATLKSRGGLTIASGDSNAGTSIFSKETWTSVGGSGSMSSSGWNVDERNSVPIRYDLRPLSELISPIFFGEEWSSPKRTALLNARSMLEREITSYLLSQPKPEDRSIGPIIYRLKFHSLVCLNNGDNAKADAELYGNIKVSVQGLEGNQEVELLNATVDNMASFSCSGLKEYPIDREVLVAGNRNPNGPGQAVFLIQATDLFENDPSAVLIDDQIFTWPVSPVFLKDWNATQPRTDIQGTIITNVPGLTDGPDIRVKVSFEAIQ